MKIGILTFHRALNYGGVLQCYALYCTLRSLGHDVDIIDYRPSYIEKWRNSDIVKTNIFCYLRSLLKNIITFRGRQHVIKNFDSFLSNMSFSTIIKEKNEFIKLAYDCYVCGSDQIWNKRITNGGDSIFMGDFPVKKAKIITYAASVGKQDLNDDYLKTIYPFLLKIDCVSVREDDLNNFLIKSGIGSSLTLDPTLICNRNIFDKIVIEPKALNYVCVYALKDEDKAVKFATKIAKYHNASIIVIRAMKSIKKYNDINIHVVECLSPGEFIGYLKNSLYNVIISFHGVVFSILYHKNFYAIKHETQGRYENLLNKINLKQRLVSEVEEFDLSPINYEGIEEKLDELKAYSLTYLSKNISNEY